MTDTLTPRVRTRVRRAESADVARHPNGTVDALAEMQKQIDELRAGVVHTVPSAPADFIKQGRVADDAELTPWQIELRQRTRPTPPDFKPESKPYNYPNRLFMKPDGMVVSLQGSPQGQDYYQTKGFLLLDRDQARHYLSVERPKIVAIQQKKSHLINTIRRAVALDPSLAAGLEPAWETDLDKMSVAELEGQLEEIMGQPTSDGRPRRVLQRLPRLVDADTRAAEKEAAQLLAGVETTPSRAAREAFEHPEPAADAGPRIPTAARTHEIEVTPQNARSFA